MNKNIIIVLAGGFFIAVLVAVMVNAALSGSKKEQVQDIKKIEVLVASKDLAVGQELSEGDLKWQSWPQDTVFIGAVIRDGEQQPSEVVNGRLLRSLVEGQPVHMSMLIEENKGDFLSANVRKGMRAVGVEVKKEVVADRLIKPGDHVDVIVTYRVRINTKNNPEAQALVNRYASETVIENVRILAIDSNDMKAVDEVEKGKVKKDKGGRKAIVTLEVDPNNSEKLLLAEKIGDIGFALRPLGDIEENKHNKMTTDIGMSQVMTNLSNLSSTSSAIRIYDGNQMREVRARSSQDTSENRVDFDVEDAPLPAQTILIDPAAIGGLNNEE